MWEGDHLNLVKQSSMTIILLTISYIITFGAENIGFHPFLGDTELIALQDVLKSISLFYGNHCTLQHCCPQNLT